MARFVTAGLDDLISQMRKLNEDSGEMARTMVDAAVIEIRDAWKQSIEKHGLIDTGDMMESIGFPKPVQEIGGVLFRDVYPVGKDRTGTRNATKAFVLNYGTSRIDATHWVDEADEASGPRIRERLQEMWGEYLETGKVPEIADSAGSAGGGISKTKS